MRYTCCMYVLGLQSILLKQPILTCMPQQRDLEACNQHPIYMHEISADLINCLGTLHETEASVQRGVVRQ